MTIPPALARHELQRTRREMEKRRKSAEMAEEYRKSFRKFIPAAWPVVEPSRVFKPAWHIDAVADHLQAQAAGQIRNLLINISPGSAKSLLCSVLFPAWMWADRPGWRSTCSSYDSGLATRDSVRCRDLITSLWYRETFKPTWMLASDQNEKTYYVNTAKGFRVSTSVGGRGTGWRSDHILCDDPINVTDQFSDAAIEFCKNWWDGTMYNRLQDMEHGTRLIIMQRVSDRDLSGHVLRTGGWEHLMIPMEYDPTRSKVTVIGWTDPRSQRGELMAPEIFSEPVIADTKRTLGQSGYAGQYQQSPTPDGGGMLKSHLWNYWQTPGANLPKVRVKMPDGTIDERVAIDRPDSFDLELQAWDFAFKDLKTSDYVAGMQVGVRGSRRFIGSHLAHDRMDLPASVSAVRVMTGLYPKAHLKLVEDKANGPAVIQSLRHEITGLIEVSPQGGKVSRVAAATPELESGNWYLPHPWSAPWVGDPESPTKSGFLAETVAFPFGANDDMCDCFAMAALRIQQEKIGGVFGVSESDLRVDPFEFGEKWPRIYGMAVTWYEVGAVWLCRRPETDMHYAYSEYVSAPTSPAHHAAEIIKPGEWIQGVMTAADTGRDEKDGYALVGKYRKLRLLLDTLPANEETMVLDLQEALSSGKLKLFGNLPRLFDQYRMYRRSDTGNLPDRNDGLIKALYVAWAGRAKMKGPAEPPKPDRNANMRGGPPQHGWMGS